MTNKEWLKDSFAIEWLNKVGERTQKNYKERYPKWLNFIGMTPTEQFQKRIKDLQSQNPKERGYFEDKVVEFKNALVAQNYKPATVQCTLTPVLSFFSAHRVPLRFKRGELKVEHRAEDKVVKEWIPDNQQMKQIYQHGDIRDRSLLLVLYQSGFSETDVGSLNIQDLPELEQCEGHYQITMYREKTDVLQRTCISEEAVHDIKAMLEERGNPTKGALFISQKGQRLTTRFINDAITQMVTKTYGAERAKEFKTKSLRDAYNDALLRANLTQEIKDTMFGHKRSGAKEKYAVSQATIIDAYNRAFQYLSVNHGTQARKDFEELSKKIKQMEENHDKTLMNLNTLLEKQQNRMEKLEAKLESLGVDPNTINKMINNLETLTKEVKALKETERKKPHKIKEYT
jgi:site-specific recombinase XerD